MQMAPPDAGDDGEDMMSEPDELGDMIREQQDLRDRTFKQGQDQRRQDQRQQDAQPGQRGRPGQPQQPGSGSTGELRQSQQALRDRLNKLLDDLRNHGFGDNSQGPEGQAGPRGPG